MQELDKISKNVFVFASIILFFWSFIMGLLMNENIKIEKNITMQTITNIARQSFNKDLAYRKWAASHGGVYVTPTKKTPPSPWMAHLPDRDIVTLDGKKLTLMNPAYMLREMMQDYSKLYGIKGRIVGKIYLNENNKANKWEASAIDSFETGTKEVMELVSDDGEEYLRLMQPMIMRQACQKCHGHLGFKNGSIRGGVSVSLPTKEYRKYEQISIKNMTYNYLAIWIFGVIAIFIMAFSAIRHLRKREKDLEEIILSAQVFNNTLDSIFITDKNGIILRINKAFSTLTGYSEDEVIGKNINILKSTHHNLDFYKNLWNQLLTKGYAQQEIWNRNKNGEVFVSIESITSLKNPDGSIKYFIAILHDITARIDAQERIQHLAHYDPLTNLPNRVLFKDRFSRSLNISKRNNTKVALAFIDIDGFKKINDTKGHPVGDKLLIEISKLIKKQIRDTDTISRLGGDEFTIIFEDVTYDKDLIPILQNILHTLRKEIKINNHSIFISASIGVSIFPDNGKDIHTLIQHADTAMYKAKEYGKNRFSFYEDYMTQQALENVALETSIQSALKNNEFVTYYQPKILSLDKSLIGMEALVRWISPSNGLIPPDKFIPVAEDMHIVDKIDMFVLEQVCEDMSTWKEYGFEDIKVSVNLSGYDVRVDNIYEQIVNIVELHNVSPKNIEFEITETYFVDFAKDDMKILYKLREYGFSMSIDDFGTGYSSLNNLKKLPVNVLKIDQSFIRDLEENTDNKKIVKMIINLAHTFSLKVIAEGVETEFQYEYLKSENCDYIQGYLESKPLPRSDFIEYIKKKITTL